MFFIEILLGLLLLFLLVGRVIYYLFKLNLFVGIVLFFVFILVDVSIMYVSILFFVIRW